MFFKYKNATINYNVNGNGPALVLLHGFLENSTMWLPFVKPLSKTHKVITLDLLGHGKTDCISYSHSMNDMALLIKSLLQHLKLQQATLIGHSMGGYVALAFAKAHSDLINGICLLNATPLPDTNERKQIRLRANKMAQTNFNQLVKMSFINLFDPSCKKEHQAAISHALQEALKTPKKGYVAANLGMMERANFKNWWLSSSIKKGMILGTNDHLIDATFHEANFKPKTDFFKLIPKGHMSHISQPKLTAKALSDFISLLNHQ